MSSTQFYGMDLPARPRTPHWMESNSGKGKGACTGGRGHVEKSSQVHIPHSWLYHHQRVPTRQPIAREIQICKGLSVDLEWRRFFCLYLGYGGGQEVVCRRWSSERYNEYHTSLGCKLAAQLRFTANEGGWFHAQRSEHPTLWPMRMYSLWSTGEVPGGLPMTSGAATSMKDDRSTLPPAPRQKTRTFPALTS